jgi:hypothetical protein
MAELHRSIIVIHGVVDTAHQTLIVTEEEDGQGSHGVDGYEKTSLLILVHHIGLWYDIHD